MLEFHIIDLELQLLPSSHFEQRVSFRLRDSLGTTLCWLKWAQWQVALIRSSIEQNEVFHTFSHRSQPRTVRFRHAFQCSLATSGRFLALLPSTRMWLFPNLVHLSVDGVRET